MDDLTLPRSEWAAVSRELDATYRGADPSDLRLRIEALLSDIPMAWADEPCTLTLDQKSAAIVMSIIERGRGQAVNVEEARERMTGLAEAEELIHQHQSPSSGTRYRIEHRTATETVVLGHTVATGARQAELSTHAWRLMAEGAQGELVLVDEETGNDVARRRLQ